ncbi:MAG: bifunctional hydroxymethylpyrimidine kinase/phosphomethylpyrimidine kinase [Muribaculaceae bacterium]
MTSAYFSCLSIAGSDSSGGAGIQADLKTMSALGVYGMTAITAITAQNTCGVTAIMPVTPEVVSAQIAAIASDIHPDAVKIGMLFSRPIIEAVAHSIIEHHLCRIVLDPVMISTSGSQLLETDAIDAMVNLLFPLADVITPNRFEAEHLAGMKIHSADDAANAAQAIIARGAKAVLIKGGHFDDTSMTDYLFSPSIEPIRFTSPKIDTANTHGTGCTLSSAIASHLALGYPLPDAVARAKAYLSQALEAGAAVAIGSGHGPVNHLFNPQQLKTHIL